MSVQRPKNPVTRVVFAHTNYYFGNSHNVVGSMDPLFDKVVGALRRRFQFITVG